MNIAITVILIVIAIVLGMIISKYNKITKLKNRVRSSESGIDVYLNQRFDLIPNLVECVKGYTRHEKELLENIVNLRTNYSKSKNLKDASKLNNGINQVIAVAENYPELKSSEQFLNLQNSLVKIESQLQAARRIYNIDVEKYNSEIQIFPNNIVAGMFGFKSEDFFQIEEYKRDNIKISGDNL